MEIKIIVCEFVADDTLICLAVAVIVFWDSYTCVLVVRRTLTYCAVCYCRVKQFGCAFVQPSVSFLVLM